MRKRETPENCYWRGNVLWGRIKVKGEEYRWSLRTGDAAVAHRRVEARRKELEAAAHYGENRRRYERAFADWTLHVMTQVSARTAKRYAVSLKQIEASAAALHRRG